LADQLLSQALDLGHQRAGGVDQLERGGRRLLRQVRSHPVGGDRHPLETAARSLVDRRRAFDALGAQPLDHLRVVDDVADRGDRAARLGRLLNDVERPADAPAYPSSSATTIRFRAATGGASVVVTMSDPSSSVRP
jgi:hypothetical protein